MKNLSHIALLFIFVACQSHNETILSEDEMTNCLIAFHLADARMLQTPITVDSARTLFLVKDAELTKQFGGDSILVKSYQYYILHPKKLERIYDRVVDSLSLLEQKLQNQ